MMIDMKYFNVYYFCHLANNSMGQFDYASTNAEFTEGFFAGEPQDFPKESVLRAYCYWLVDRVFYDQANYIANNGTIADFDPISWENQAALKYKGEHISLSDEVDINDEDYLDTFCNYTDFLDMHKNELYCDIITSIAIEVEYILFQNRDFLLRFNDQQSVYFEDRPRERVYIPEWVKRAVLFRDKGRCVFCKKDLTGLYSLLEDNDKQFDHIVPLHLGGLNDVCNIQLTCQTCNLRKSDTSQTSTLYQSAY